MATEAVEERKLEVEASMEEEDEEDEESKEGRKGEGRGAEVVEEEEEEDDWTTFEEINEEEKEGEEERGKKRKDKGPRKDSDLKEKEPPATPTGRPARERKTVERYSAPSVGRSVTKGLTIEKGRGTQLKDIPNVEFKLSKRKPDENLRMLHSILFGKKATVHSLKRNIRQFSGYVWLESEEKQRAKIKEKLDKCVKEKLLDFCDVLNIPINKAAVRKEELSAKLLEFLESPHATTDVSLAEKEQKGKMRKRKVLGKTIVSRETSGEASSKKQKQKHTVDEEDESDEKADDPLESQGDSHEEDVDDTTSKEEKEKEDSESEEEEEEEEEEEGMKEQPSSKKSLKKNVKEGSVGRKKGTSTPTKKSTQEKSVKSPEKSTKKASGSKKSAIKIEDASVKPSKSKGSATRKSEKGYNSSNKGKPSSKKETSNSKAKSSTAGEGKTNSGKKQKAEPTREEMHEVVVDILKKVDFNTATLSDILRQLGAHFDVDLMHRKAEVKAIITDVINSMSDDEEEEVEFEALDGDGAVRNKDQEDDA